MCFNKLLSFAAAILSVAIFQNVSAEEKILIVVTNHSELGETGTKTGYYLTEVAHPWKVFREAGYEVEFASPLGGYAPMDPKSFDLEDEANKALWTNLDAVESLVHTQKLGDLNDSDYKAIFFAGGHGTMWDFPASEDVQNMIRTFFESDRPVGAVCHGPAALVNVTLSNGEPLVKDKIVNAFTNEEEAAVQLTEVMPFLLETKLIEKGAQFTESGLWEEHVAVDGVLVTGQNPSSATAAAEAIVELLKD